MAQQFLAKLLLTLYTLMSLRVFQKKALCVVKSKISDFDYLFHSPYAQQMEEGSSLAFYEFSRPFSFASSIASNSNPRDVFSL